MNTDTPLRVLHIGNIANNAYNNAKIQRRFGIDADVICFDYYHIMSCPEWEDSGFEGEIKDPFKPDWWSVDLKGFERPDWFAQGPVNLCRKYLIAKRTQSELKNFYWKRLNLSRWLLLSDRPYVRLHRNTTAIGTKRYLWLFAYYIGYGYSQLVWHYRSFKKLVLNKLVLKWKHAESLDAQKWFLRSRKVWRALRRLASKIKSYAILFAKFSLFVFLKVIIALGISVVVILLKLWCLTPWSNKSRYNGFIAIAYSAKKEVLENVNHYFFTKKKAPTSISLPEGVNKEDALQYLGDLGEWTELYKYYDIVQAYSIDPIRPMLAGISNYTAYEHGTIRQIPFNDDAMGRLSKACYRHAPVVFITNSDNISAAKKLKLDPSRVVYLPHAFDETKLLRFRNDVKYSISMDPDKIVFFSPARQHWRDNNLSMSKRNDKFIRAFATMSHENPNIVAKFVEWGEDLELSKALILELGIEDRVSWVKPLKKRELWMEYLNSHAVVDQFLIPAIGGVGFEAMTLGKRVLTAIDVQQNVEFFGSTPVLMHCTEQAEIEHRISEVLADPLDDSGFGVRATEWMMKNHSSQRVCDLQLEAYHRLLSQKQET